MFSHLLRGARLGVATSLFLAVSLASSPASADAPRAWGPEPHVSGFQFLLVLFLIPLSLALVISLLVSLPSMMHKRGYEPGHAWRAETEWFGGPDKGVAALDEVSPAALENAREQTGGVSARW
ncbi:MAG: hypothetical protein M3Z50_00800 [Actinomycetota bacterium]|nr:hypothetical protein [Actinomycetota bacterium]